MLEFDSWCYWAVFVFYDNPYSLEKLGNEENIQQKKEKNYWKIEKYFNIVINEDSSFQWKISLKTVST